MLYYDEKIFKETGCFNCTAILVAKQLGVKKSDLGLKKEILEQATNRLLSLGLIDDELSKIQLEFEAFWEAYGKVGVKKNAFSAFKKLSSNDKKLVMNNVKAYVASTPDIRYRKHAQGYLNQRMFDPKNFKIQGSTTEPANINESRLNALLHELSVTGVVKDYKGNALTTEIAVRQFFEREKHFRLALQEMVSQKFGCTLLDPRLKRDGDYFLVFEREKRALIDKYFT